MGVVVNTVKVALSGSIPAGTNVIGGVTQSGAWSVSLSGTPNVSISNSSIAVTQSGSWNVGITGTPTVTVGNASIPVTDNGGSLTVDGTVAATQSGTWNIGSITTLPSIPTGSNVIGAVTQSGTWNIDSITTLPALSSGTNTIGKLGANSGVDIGDVDVTSVTPGTSAANLGKAEDTAHAGGDVGVMSLGVRNDTQGALTSADGDYSPLAVDSAGRVQVVDGGTTLSVDDGGSSITVDGTVAATQSGTWNINSITTLPALATGSNVIGAVTQSGTWNIGSITTLPALPTGSNTIGNVGVNGTVTVATHAVTQSGTWTVGVQGTGASDIGKAEDAAHTSGDTGVAMWAVRNDNAATSFVSANGDYSPIAVDDKGRVIITGTVSAQSGVGTTITDGSASVTTTAGAISGLGADATRLSVTLTNLGTDNVWIGTTTIAANRGLRLAPGQTAILDKSPTPAIWAVSSSGTQTVAFLVEK